MSGLAGRESDRSRKPSVRRRVGDLPVVAPLYALFAVFRLLPIDAASALGG
jgi:hypothetical protein